MRKAIALPICIAAAASLAFPSEGVGASSLASEHPIMIHALRPTQPEETEPPDTSGRHRPIPAIRDLSLGVTRPSAKQPKVVDANARSFDTPIWRCIISTESSGNWSWSNVSPKGARGGLQFMPGTWIEATAWAGVSSSDHSEVNQKAAGLALYRHRGFEPWAGDCGIPVP